MADKRGVYKLNDYIDRTLEGQTDTVDDVWIFPDNNGAEFKYVDGTVTAAPAATPPAPTLENKRHILVDLYTPTMSTDQYPYKGNWGHHTAIGSTVIYSSNIEYVDFEQYEMNWHWQSQTHVVSSLQALPIGGVAIHDASKLTSNLKSTFGRDVGFNTVSTGISAVGAGFSEGWVYDANNSPGGALYGDIDIPAFRGSLNSEVNLIKQPELPHTTRYTGYHASVFSGGHHFGSFIAINESEGKMAIGAESFDGETGRVYVMNTDGTGIKSCVAPGPMTASGPYPVYSTRSGWDEGLGNKLAIGGGKVFVGAHLTDEYWASNGNERFRNVGGVHVYNYNGTLLHTINSPEYPVTQSNYGLSGDQGFFGENVYLSNDNSTLYVSDRRNTTTGGNGGGRVFRFNASNYSYLGVFDDDAIDSNNYSNDRFGDDIIEVNNGKLIVGRPSFSFGDEMYVCDSDGSNIVQIEIPWVNPSNGITYNMTLVSRSLFYNSSNQKTYFLAYKGGNFYTDGSYLVEGHVGVGNTFVVDSYLIHRDPPGGTSSSYRHTMNDRTVGITTNRVFISLGGRRNTFDYEVYTYPDPSVGFDIEVYPII